MLIYLASYPRSGNLWSQQLILHSFTGVSLYSIYSSSQIDELYSRFGPEIQRPRKANIRDLLVPELRRRIAASNEIIVLKTHEFPPRTFFKGEKVLHVVRHPGAAFWSYVNFLRDVENSAKHLDEIILGSQFPGSWSAHSAAWMKAGRTLAARYQRFSYEQMHQSISEVRSAMGQLFGLEPGTDLPPMPTFEEQHQRRPHLVRSGSVDEWRANFTPAQHRMLLRIHGRTMQKLGYSIDAPHANGDHNAQNSLSAAISTDNPDANADSSQSILQRMLGYRYYNYVITEHLVHRVLQIVRWRATVALGRHRDVPMVLHITHPKAGSQWVARIFKGSVARDRFIRALPRVKHLDVKNLHPGAVLPTLYLPRTQLEAATAGYHKPMRRVVVIRDLRDTLVSLYFSLRYSHDPQYVADARQTLDSLSFIEGLRWLMKAKLPRTADIQRSWIHGDDRLLMRYEDIVADEHTAFQHILDYCEIRMNPEQQRRLIAKNSFAVRSGRAPGQEDIMSHQRKGIVGDWRNHFTAELKDEFKALYGDVLIETGYEADSNW